MLFVSCASSSHQIPAPSLEVGSRAVVPGDRRGLLWRGLRDKHNRVGLFEINPGHELHRMTRMMQEGLWAATEVFKENPPKVNSIPCTSNSKRDGDPAGYPSP